MAIPVYRQNSITNDWEVASVYESDDCDSLGRSEGPFCPDYGLTALHEEERFYTPAEYEPHPSPWDARFAPGKPGGFLIPPHASAVPPPGAVLSPAVVTVPSRDAYRPPGNGRLTPEPECQRKLYLLDSAPSTPLPELQRPVLGLIMPPPSHSSRHTSPVLPSHHPELPPHHADVGYTSERSHGHLDVPLYSGLPSGERHSKTHVGEVRPSAQRQRSYQGSVDRPRVDHRRPQVTTRRGSVWQKVVRSFSPPPMSRP